MSATTWEVNSYLERWRLLQILGYKDYAEYLAGDLWKHVRLCAFKCHGSICKICGGLAEVIHHLDYSLDILTGRSMRGLVPLCDSCHHKVEFDRKGKEYVKREIPAMRKAYGRLVKQGKKSGNKALKCKRCGTPGIRFPYKYCKGCHKVRSP